MLLESDMSLKTRVLQCRYRLEPKGVRGSNGVQAREVSDWRSIRYKWEQRDQNDAIWCRSREIKMMPFGAGRRMCPGFGLAMLHLVWKAEKRAVDGDDIDLSEKDLEFMSAMKNPLQALISPRLK